MRSDTQSIMIGAPVSAVHAFVADPANLARWAVGFAQEVRQEKGQWIVRTAAGDVQVGVAAALSTVDFHMRPAPGFEVSAFSRVLPAGDASVYVFTQFQGPGMPDEVFDAQVKALGHELIALKAVLEVACPAGR